MLWLTLILSALMTFALRFVFFMKSVPLKLGPKAYRLLKFTAPTVLTAMWVPIVVMPQGDFSISLHNPYLLAGLVAIGLSLTIKKTIWVVIFSLLSFALFKQIL